MALALEPLRRAAVVLLAPESATLPVREEAELLQRRSPRRARRSAPHEVVLATAAAPLALSTLRTPTAARAECKTASASDLALSWTKPALGGVVAANVSYACFLHSALREQTVDVGFARQVQQNDSLLCKPT